MSVSYSGGIRFASTAVFSMTVMLSAFLLFSVQPMFAKMILPKLGGSPAVWSVAMVFFQSLVLAGYAYAHRLSRLDRRSALIVHLLLLLAAFWWLPPGLADRIGLAPTDGHAWWLIGLFATSVGLPVFALSAHAPLLQSWYARCSGATDPYALYVASNIGSFGALLTYPLLLERFITLGQQAKLWAGGFVLLTVSVALCGFFVAGESRATPTQARSPAPSLALRARWVLLSFLPSGLLVAVTAHLTTDVAAFPLLWVLPLGLYLLSFVFAFRGGSGAWMRFLLVPVPAALAVIASVGFFTREVALWSSVHLATSFILMLLVHRALYEIRPAVDRSTDFYLAMSLGGVAGGIFTALIAPRIFSTVLEYPFLLAATAALALPESVLSGRRGMPLLRIIAAFLIVAVFLASMADPDDLLFVLKVLGGYVLAVAAYLAIADKRLFALLCGAVALVPATRHDPAVILAERSFFGVHLVKEVDGFRFLQHGTTKHGAVRITDGNGNPLQGRPVPATYYAAGGALADALAAARVGSAGEFAVASVGLGAGSMACHAREGDVWSFFEIDPVVVAIATDPRRFRFLADCTPDARIVLGDARMTLAVEHRKYDVILLDAFSSSAIPAHLLTREAVSVYRKLLKPNGALVFHISNRHLDLAPPLARAAAAEGMTAFLRIDDFAPDFEAQRFGSDAFVMLVPDEAKSAAFRDAGFRRQIADGAAPWTDDFADVLGSWKKLRPASR